MIEVLKPLVNHVMKYQKHHFQSGATEFKTKVHKLDFVSQVDLHSQEMLLPGIFTYFPKSGIIAEEMGQDKISEDGTCFVIDPLDGTANYKIGLPFWAISIGFIKDDEIIEGIIAFPFSGEIICSAELLPFKNAAPSLKKASFYGIDSAFENIELKGLKIKRRQFGASVPTLYGCCASTAQGGPQLDFALMGKSSFWDICAAVACLKKIGGALIMKNGLDLVTSKNVMQALGGPEKMRNNTYVYVASGNRSIAEEAYGRYLKE
jgi:myo-inositol-1(or 4)-monophosphatase